MQENSGNLPLTCGNVGALHRRFSAESGNGRQRQAVAFLRQMRHAFGMDKAEHAAKLRAAIARSGHSRDVVADATGHQPRSVTNWTSKKNPTMPDERTRAALRELLGNYDSPGDPVEIALDHSELVEWRRDTVRGFYKRHLSEQREGRSA